MLMLFAAMGLVLTIIATKKKNGLLLIVGSLMTITFATLSLLEIL